MKQIKITLYSALGILSGLFIVAAVKNWIQYKYYASQVTEFSYMDLFTEDTSETINALGNVENYYSIFQTYRILALIFSGLLLVVLLVNYLINHSKKKQQSPMTQNAQYNTSGIYNSNDVYNSNGVYNNNGTYNPNTTNNSNATYLSNRTSNSTRN